MAGPGEQPDQGSADGSRWLKRVLIFGGAVLILTPLVMGTCDRADELLCTTQAMRLGHALRSYADDYDNRLPDTTDGWPAALDPYLRPNGAGEITLCPQDHARPSYALAPSLRLPDVRLTDLPGETVLIFETDDGVSPVWRHRNGANYGYVDGHTRWLSRAETPGVLLAQ